MHHGVRLQDPFLPRLEPDERQRRRSLYDARVEYYYCERPWIADEEIVEAVEQALTSKGQMPTIDQLSRIRAMLSQAKVHAVQEWIKDREEEDEPIVLFSQHVSILKKIAVRPGWQCFHGGLTPKNRAVMVKEFQAGQIERGLAISIGAGGEGITLTRAAVCAFIDLSWNPAKNHQAESRLIRIGAERHDLEAAKKAIAESGCTKCVIVDGRATACPEHKTAITVVRFVAKHVVDALVMTTLKEKEALLTSLEWSEEEQE
jgi:SNF2 family DNA or RNA helicase